MALPGSVIATLTGQDQLIPRGPVGALYSAASS